MSVEILNPVKTVAVGGASWDVKELNWRDGMHFLGMIGKHAGEIVSADGKSVSVDLAKIPGLIGNVKELGDFLLTKSTGKSQQEIDALRFADALAVMETAIELNLSEELLQRGKNVAGRVGAAFGVSSGKALATSETPSIS